MSLIKRVISRFVRPDNDMPPEGMAQLSRAITMDTIYGYERGRRMRIEELKRQGRWEVLEVAPEEQERLSRVVEAEREECARILDREAEREGGLAGPRPYQLPSSQARRLRRLANEMRCRGK